ncbi:MAG: TonB-dependent receptor, partial [Zoogloea sp.]|nr:TonB-dependent receptor [Zoogloea sp.]
PVLAKYFGLGAITGQADVHGVELAATWRPSLRTWLTLNHAIEHIEGPTLTRAEQDLMPSAYVATSAPRHSTTLTGAWSVTDDWQLSFAHHWIGSMSWYQDMVDYGIPFHRRLDARIARRFNLANTRGEISLVGQNIDGTDTPPNNPLYVDPQRIFAVLSLEL